MTWKCSNLACQREIEVEINGRDGWLFCGECAAADEMKTTGNVTIVE